MMTNTKRFHIGDILSITDGHLVSPTHIQGVQELLSWVVDDAVFTHQLPRVADQVAPFLREQFPDLADIELPDGLGKEGVCRVLAELVEQHGAYRYVPQIDPDGYTHIDPLAELVDRFGVERVIPVVIP